MKIWRYKWKRIQLLLWKFWENDISSIYSTITGKLRFTKNLLSDRFFFHIWYCQHEISNLFFTRLSISLNDLKPFFFSNLILNLKNMHFVAKVWEMGSIWTFFNVHSKFEFTFTKIWIRKTCFLLNLILLPFYFDKCGGPVYHIIKPSHYVSVFCVL